MIARLKGVGLVSALVGTHPHPPLSKLSKQMPTSVIYRYKLLAYILKVHFVKGLLMYMTYSYIIKALLRHGRS